MLSPQVSFTEVDATQYIKGVATSIGATVIDAHWGVCDEIVQISNEQQLVAAFGKPSNTKFKDWYSCFNFLAYANDLRVVRVVTAAAKNADDVGTSTLQIKNTTAFESATLTGKKILARYPGADGNKLVVSFATPTTFGSWAHKALFDRAPVAGVSHREIYWIVKFDGVIVERFVTTTDTAAKDGYGNLYNLGAVINRTSQYIYVNTAAFPGTGAIVGDGTDITLTGGVDSATPADGDYQLGWDKFANPSELDINLPFMGGASAVVGKYLIDNIAVTRRDCVAFVSPEQADVVGAATPVTDILTTRTDYGSTSYAFMDGNYKYQYDKYNDVYRWLPLNADMAGLAARTDYLRDPWWSFGGYNRGVIKNVVKLAFQPTLAQRDELYKNNVNPILTERSEGTILLGDKTLQSMASAFDRINVRRLFITLEKAISTQAKYQLFEFNDEFTRNRFVQTITPFLRDIQGRRGIIDFRVIADETVNTPVVIDSNEFRANILIKPNKSINFIGLTFTAVASGVSFDEFVAN